MALTNASYANYPYYNHLPMMQTNFGGDTQLSIVEPYQSNSIYCNFNPAAQATWGTPWVTPGIDMGAVQRIGDGLLNQEFARLSSSVINANIQNLNMTKTRLNAMFQSEETTQEEKDKINKLLDEVAAKEKELAELGKNGSLTHKDRYIKASELEKQIRELVQKVSTLQQEIATRLNQKKAEEAENSNNTDNTNNTDGTGNKDGTNNTDGTSSTTSDGNTFSSDVQDVVDTFYDATEGWTGTKDDEFNAVCDYITKDNIMDVMLAWNKYHSATNDESFMEAFMYDADGDQKVEYGKKIYRLLREKADEYGVYDELKDDFKEIIDELDDFSIDNTIYENYDNIIAKIAEKMGSKYGRPSGSETSEDS